MEPKVFSVYEINKYIKNKIENDFVLENVCVCGEISNYRPNTSGHIYMTLKDDLGALNCVMFKSAAQYLPFDIKNGMQVIAVGRISLYEKNGVYQLYCEAIEPLGVGSLHLALEQSKQKFRELGMFDNEHKKPLPQYPKTIAVITSKKGAVIQDIINITKRRNSNVKIVVVDTPVQGEAASAKIVSAINKVDKWGKADIIILARGGGSIEDLWCFNNESVAKAVFMCKTPIITAVGHETDTTLVDFVSDMRASTPSEAGELAIPELLQSQKDIVNTLLNIQSMTEQKIKDEYGRFMGIHQKNILNVIKSRIQYRKNNVNSLYKSINNKIENKLQSENMRNILLNNKIQANNPISIINKGYSLTTKNDKPIDISNIQKGDIITTNIKQGKIISEVVDIEKE